MNLLMKVQTMHDEGLITPMCLVESIISERPIASVSDDINGPVPLTPNHLLLSEGPMPPGVFDKKNV